MKQQIKKTVFNLGSLMIRPRFQREEKFHTDSEKGYDDKYIQTLFKTVMQPSYYLDYLKYYGNPLTSSHVELDEKASLLAQEFKKNGFIKLDQNVYDFADYLQKAYFSPLEESKKIEQINLENSDIEILPRYNSQKKSKDEVDKLNGVEINNCISLKDQKVLEFLANPRMLGIINNYYGRQPYYRNLPVIAKHNWQVGRPAPYNGMWHVDHFRQISVMVLINDIGIEDTHMEFALGTHKNLRTAITKEGAYFSHQMIEQRYKIAYATGKKGDVFIFDTAALHRACYLQSNNPRKILHLNITPGHDLENVEGQKWEWVDKLNLPNYAKEAFKKITF